LVAGYQQRVLHLAHDQDRTVTFELEVDRDGTGAWRRHRKVQAPSAGYGYLILSPRDRREWIRLRTDRDAVVTAYLHLWSPRPSVPGEARLFAAVPRADEKSEVVAGIIRPAAHNRSLQWLAQRVDAFGATGTPVYREVALEGRSALRFAEPEPNRAAEVLEVGLVQRDWDSDAASVVVKDSAGRRWRLPKGAAVYERPFPTGWPRGVREAVSERYLANLHGTFYEIPRDAKSQPDYGLMKPVATHNRWIADFCTWRGLFVISGTRLGAPADGQFFADAGGAGLWFGAIDDLWKLGKPVGRGGPWQNTSVEAGQPSDPYLMTGYDRKRLELSHDSEQSVTFAAEVDFDHNGFHEYARIEVPRGRKGVHRFPRGFHAHWVRLVADQACRATATFIYE
jgi:hypothetical protein